MKWFSDNITKIRARGLKYSSFRAIIGLKGGLRMKHYEKLIELGCFSRSDIAAYLGNDSTAASLLREYLKKYRKSPA